MIGYFFKFALLISKYSLTAVYKR